MPAQLEADPPVLRAAVFAQVQAGGKFEDVDDRALEFAHLDGDGHFLQHAINAVADAKVVGERLHVDVGGALAQGLADDLVDEFFDRRLFRFVLVEDVDLFAATEIDVLLHPTTFEQFLKGFGADPVDLAQGGQNAFARVDFVAYLLRHGFGHRLPCEQVEGIVGQQGDRVVVGLDREQLVAQGDAGRQLGPHFRGGFGHIRPAPPEVKFVGQFTVESVFVDLGTVEQSAHEGRLDPRRVLQRCGHFVPVSCAVARRKFHQFGNQGHALPFPLGGRSFLFAGSRRRLGLGVRRILLVVDSGRPQRIARFADPAVRREHG